MTLRRHLDVMSSFKEWEDKNDPVGGCVKNCSMAAFWKMVEAVAYYVEQEDGPVIRLATCTCYSPFHDQSFGSGWHGTKVRPFLRIGKGTKGEPYKWECVLCTSQHDYPGGEKVLRGGKGYWFDLPGRRQEWALYI